MRKTNQDSLWIRCPTCNNKTRTKVYEDTVLLNFPLFCPKCKKERLATEEEKEALTNIIQLVRFANHQIETLESLYPSAQQRFNLWYGQVQRTVTESQAEPFAECCLEERVTIKVVFLIIPYYISDELLQLGIAQLLVQRDV